MKLRSFFALFSALSLTMAGAAFAQSPKAKGHAKERILVKFKKNVPQHVIDKKLGDLNWKIEKKIPGPEIHLIKLPPGLDENSAAKKFKGDADVEFAEVDGLLKPDEFVPNDPYYVNTWALKNISASFAWDVTKGSSGITIAILDTGVDSTHPDLSGNLVPGWNVSSNNSDTSPINPHGTAVAGVAAARLDNSIGVSGICGNCKIMPIRITDTSDGYAYYSSIAAGVAYAADRGVKVVNNSFGFWMSSSATSSAQYLKSKGGVLVIAAGNDGATYNNFSDQKDYLVVSGTDSNDLLFGWSSRGTVINISAPGSSYSTSVGGGYGVHSGTSFAAPSVSGVAGLVFSINPNLTPDQVMNILKSSADDIGAVGYDTNFGYGRVNAERAVAMAGAPQPVNGSCGTSNGKVFSSTPNSGLCNSGSASAVTLSGSTYSWTCAGINGGSAANCSASYQAPDTSAPSAPSSLTVSITLIKSGNGKKATTVPAANLAWRASTDNVGVSSYSVLRNGSVIATVTGLSYQDKAVTKGASYTYSVIATDAAGNKSAASNAVTVTP